MPSLAKAAQTLTTLARSRSAADRVRLLTALGALCESVQISRRPEVEALLTELLTTMLSQASAGERARLAERLAAAAWTPPRVVLELALDAGPELAQRADLSAEATALMASRGEPAVLMLLARNAGIELSPRIMAQLVAAARTQPGLRAALIGRAELNSALAEDLRAALHAPLRKALDARFPGPRRDLADQACLEDASDLNLVTKLHAAGRLGPGFLLSALRQGRVDRFQHGAATLAGLAVDEIRAACEAAEPERLATICAAAGLDRSLLPTVRVLLQQHAAAPAGSDR